MRQERMYTFIGIFVIGAAALLIYAAILFYEVYLQERMESYVMFFSGSLEGLEPKSTVTYRGVKIGEITQVELTENKQKHSVEIPVYVQFFVERARGFKRDPIRLLIDKGYVADISKPNFITGSASIELIKADKSQDHHQQYYNGYPIFPTAVVTKKYTSLDEALKTAKKTMQDISEFIRSKEMRATIDSLDDMARSIEGLSNDLNQSMSPALNSFVQSMEQVSKAAYSAQNFMDYLSQYPESLIRGRP